jgi:hypothetical protein
MSYREGMLDTVPGDSPGERGDSDPAPPVTDRATFRNPRQRRDSGSDVQCDWERRRERRTDPARFGQTVQGDGGSDGRRDTHHTGAADYHVTSDHPSPPEFYVNG